MWSAAGGTGRQCMEKALWAGTKFLGHPRSIAGVLVSRTPIPDLVTRIQIQSSRVHGSLVETSPHSFPQLLYHRQSTPNLIVHQAHFSQFRNTVHRCPGYLPFRLPSQRPGFADCRCCPRKEQSSGKGLARLYPADCVSVSTLQVYGLS